MNLIEDFKFHHGYLLGLCEKNSTISNYFQERNSQKEYEDFLKVLKKLVEVYYKK